MRRLATLFVIHLESVTEIYEIQIAFLAYMEVEMKKHLFILLALCGIGLGCTSIETAKSEIKQMYSKESEINITGYWYNEHFGPARISQINNDISGAFKGYFVDGYVYGSTAYLILSSNNQDAESTLQLALTKEGNLSGSCDRFGFDQITLIRESKDGIRKRMDEDESTASNLDAGRRWLLLNSGNAEANIDGNYNNFEWGSAVFIQKGNTLIGNIGSYEIEGIVNGRTIYFLIKYGKKLYYTAIMQAMEQGKLLGKYFRGVSYSSLKEGHQLILVK